MAVVFLWALVAIATGAPSAGAQATEQTPSASIKRSDWSPDEKMFVEGVNWPRGNVAIQVCGNNAVNGTPDCDMAGSRNFGVASDDGAFRGNIFVRIPPAPCPCVLLVRSTTVSAQFSIPITISGATVNSGPPPVRHEPAQTTLKLTTKISRGALWREALAIQPTRTIEVKIQNSGTRDSGPGSVDITYGKSDSPTGFGQLLSFKSLAPGESTVVQASIPLDPISFGDFHMRVRVDATYAHAEETHSTSVQPWGLILLLIAAIVVADIFIIRKVRRWRRQEQDGDADLIDDGPIVDEGPDAAAVVLDLGSEILAVNGNGHVNGHRVVTFTLPGFDAASSVTVCGDFNEWAVDAAPMTHARDGWTVALDLETDRTYRYRFVVDNDQWEDDPTAVERVPNSFGGEDCVLRT